MIADLTEQCDDFLRIADIHLAAEGLDIEQFYAGHVTPLTLFNSIDSTQFTRRKSTAFAFCTTHSAFSGLSYRATCPWLSFPPNHRSIPLFNHALLRQWL